MFYPGLSIKNIWPVRWATFPHQLLNSFFSVDLVYCLNVSLEYLSLLGVSIDEELNKTNGSSSSGLISSPESKVGLYVVRTDEELMIAKQVARLFSEGENTSTE